MKFKDINSILKTPNVKKLNILTFLSVILIFSFLFLNFSNAQTLPQFLVSWQAQNYAPNWYQGKILPVNGTSVEVNFELIDNGKPADLSEVKVRWYINDNLVRNENDGLGIKNLKFINSDYGGGEIEIRIVAVDYLGGDLIDKIIRIPTAAPETIINAPYPDNLIGVGKSIIQAIPFFFNIRDIDSLSIEWSVNGQKSTGAAANPFLLSLNIGSETPQGIEINVSALVKNIFNNMEFANKTIQLRVK